MKKIISIMFLLGIITTSVIGVTNLNASENTQIEPESQSLIKSWNYNFGNSYVEGDIVINGNEKKVVLQNFVTNGDSNWWNADSLFKRIANDESTKINFENMEINESFSFGQINTDGEESVIKVTVLDKGEVSNMNFQEVRKHLNNQLGFIVYVLRRFLFFRKLITIIQINIQLLKQQYIRINMVALK